MTSIGLLRYQRPMLAMLPRMVLRGLGRTGNGPAATGGQVERIIAAPTDHLVDQYARWCGATDRYRTTLPPHMVSHWGLPIATQLLLQTPFPLAKVLNQGVTLRIHGELPRHEPLHCQGSILHISETGERIRMTVRLVTGTAAQKNLVETDLHMVFIRAKSRTGKKPVAPDSATTWHRAGNWRATDHDGLQFALLTGDFNPIHWIGLAGRLSALGSKVLHGFGSFARTYEQLGPQPVKEIDLRFLRPVPLPSGRMEVEQSAVSTNSQVELRVVDERGKCYLAGTASYRA